MKSSYLNGLSRVFLTIYKQLPPEHRSKAVVALIIIATLLLAGGGIGGWITVRNLKDSEMAQTLKRVNDAHTAELAARQAQIDSLGTQMQAQIDALNERIRGHIERISALESDLARKDGEIQQKSSVIQALETREVETLKARDQTIVVLETRVADLQEEIASLSRTPTPTSRPDKNNLPSTGTDCDTSVIQAVDRANKAQIGYWLGTAGIDDLNKSWGDAASQARQKADALLRNLRGKLLNVDYRFAYCRVIRQIGTNKIEVETTENWEYKAQLNCGTKQVEDKLLASYEQQTYHLILDSDGWRIFDWTLGNEKVTDPWTCPSAS